MKYLLPFICIGLVFLSSCGTTQRTDRTRYTGDNQRQSLVSDALAMKGKRYKYGGASPRSGFDCSGLVYYVYSQNNYTLPRTSRDQAKQGRKISKKDIQAGDLLFFKKGGKINHVAIVISYKDGICRAIHSTTSRGVIVEDVFASSYWKPRYTFARSVF